MESIRLAKFRNHAQRCFESAESTNEQAFLEGKAEASEKYVFPNQSDDAKRILMCFFNDRKLRAVIVQKLTKVGALGLIYELLMRLSTHPDDEFVVPYNNLYVLTGMSNSNWQQDITDCAPSCFKKNMLHRAQFNKIDEETLKNIQNAVIIIDEIDTGDKPDQMLHSLLERTGLMDIEEMLRRNVRFVLISATALKHIHGMHFWGEYHKAIQMTIPNSYVGHKDFKERGILREYYPMKTNEAVRKWIQEDILENYHDDYRIHLVRLDKKNTQMIQRACEENGIKFVQKNSESTLSNKEFKALFENRTRHVVLAVKGMMRRADLIPNEYKYAVGAVMERYTKNPDYNVLMQGLVGRMTGYWREKLDSGHKTGPYRLHITAVDEYIKAYEDPLGDHRYQCSGYRRNIRTGDLEVDLPTLISPDCVRNLPNVEPALKIATKPRLMWSTTDSGFRSFASLDDALQFAHKTLKLSKTTKLIKNMQKMPKEGAFYKSNLPLPGVFTEEDVLSFLRTNKLGTMLPIHKTTSLGKTVQRTWLCYADRNDPNSVRFVMSWARVADIVNI
jgi:hypothetical protein